MARRSSGKKSESAKPSRVTLKSVNDALAERGYDAMLVKGGGYFFFRGAEPNAWLDRTVPVARVSDLTLQQWVRAFQQLKQKNAEIRRAGSRSRK